MWYALFMANTSGLLEHLRELLDEASEGLPGVAARRMFGCHAVFADSNIFGLVWKTGRLGLKVPDAARYEELMAMPGAGQWCAGSKAMSHWVLVPEEFHDDPEELGRWVKLAHRLAGSGAKAKAPAKAPASARAPAKAKAPAKKAKAPAKAPARKPAKRTNGRPARA